MTLNQLITLLIELNYLHFLGAASSSKVAEKYFLLFYGI